MAYLILNTRGAGIGPTQIEFSDDDALVSFLRKVHEKFSNGEGVWMSSGDAADDETEAGDDGETLFWVPPTEGLIARFDEEPPKELLDLIDCN